MTFPKTIFFGVDNPAKVRTASTPKFFFKVISHLYEVDGIHVR